MFELFVLARLCLWPGVVLRLVMALLLVEACSSGSPDFPLVVARCLAAAGSFAMIHFLSFAAEALSAPARS